MRIQEMKPGILHLKKKMDDEGRESFFETLAADFDPEPVPSPRPAPDSELNEPRWSVVSFHQREGAGGLTYDQASALITDLDSHGVPGLCIVTDDAADRIGGR